jgi:hypothetical protein
VQQSGLRLSLLQVEQQHRQFQFCASGLAVFLAFWRYLISPQVKVRRSEWILHTSSLSYPSSGEVSIEKISHTDVIMQWSTVMLKVTVFIRKQILDARYDVLKHR